LTAVIDGLDVKIVADSGDLEGILALPAGASIVWSTTNPTLMLDADPYAWERELTRQAGLR
jgi:transaldolase